MTAPAPTLPPGLPPKRLSFLLVPLLVLLLYSAFTLLTLPFSGPVLMTLIPELEKQMGVPVGTLPTSQIPTILWLSFALTVVQTLLLYFTRRALLEGRAWGRVSSIVIGVLSLLIFPLGTVLGLVMLVGAFDRDVVAYTRG